MATWTDTVAGGVSVTTRSFGFPLPVAGRGVSGLPLDRNREMRPRVSNQNGAPSEMARTVNNQPPTTVTQPLPLQSGFASPDQPIGTPSFATLATSFAALSNRARVSGWYKRKTQAILLVIGTVLVLALNANTLAIADRLWTDQSIRAAVVQQADQAASQPSGDDPRARLDSTANDVASVAKLGVPMGWSGDAKPDWSGSGWVSAVGGWLLTVLAISLGAPFWFDALGRISRLRSSGKPETPLPATGSGKPNERVVTETPPATVSVQVSKEPG